MPHLALMTIGRLLAPWGDPIVRGFEERIDETFATAAKSPGFVALIGSEERGDGEVEQGALDGGPQVVPPAFADPEVQDRIATTLSVWSDAESAFAFSYRGIHGAALRDRHDWFTKVDAPSHVAWWIDEGHLPTWAEAAERHAELASTGPSARAFDFRSPFDADGRATTIDREAVRRHAPSPTA